MKSHYNVTVYSRYGILSVDISTKYHCSIIRINVLKTHTNEVRVTPQIPARCPVTGVSSLIPGYSSEKNMYATKGPVKRRIKNS